MARLIPDIHRRPVPSGWRYPLKYAELEACFAGRAEEDLYLDVHFTSWRVFRDTPRELLLPDGDYHLVEARYDPERQEYPDERGPWAGVENARVVNVRVYAVPRATAGDGLHHGALAGAVADALERAPGRTLVDHRWEFRILLRGNERELEVRSRRWTGLRPEDPVRRRVPLARPEP